MCGAAHAACGTASDSIPVDERMEVAAVGGPLKKYEVTTPSGVKTTMKLNDDDARRLGVLDAPEQDSTEEPTEPEQAPAKKRAVSNKARTAAADKGGAGGGDD
ncbi:hypothetical protein [Streptomyces sp. AC555_RSS877]|uniref:hypothetical protein n=1 Tax=Streptomyces sp. AC555_RSS877 TaxID=2823688 RepID=UPI001C257701|nr:hypothetical protein [Streptomyces sp. AC555_RSS877]